MKAVPFKKLGPGLLFAGAAIGVSHLVQSTRAGADFGFGLLWALFLVNIIKYPFFQMGPRYASVTGKSLLDGYYKLGKPVLWVYFFLTLGTMFTIQTAVTIVTAGIAVQLFGISNDIAVWSVVITLLCAAILAIGKYRILDKLMKVITNYKYTVCGFFRFSRKRNKSRYWYHDRFNPTTSHRWCGNCFFNRLYGLDAGPAGHLYMALAMDS